MNYNKYENNGWGLSLEGLFQINNIITSIEKDNIRIVEFGSGKSTEFLSDLNIELNDKNLQVNSFDNDENYAYSPKEKDCVNLKIRNLVECTDKEYNNMFDDGEINNNNMLIRTAPPKTSQKNCFYDIKENDLNGCYDLMILDGPNGNGRNISFLYMKNHLKEGSYIFIDDYTHYDFLNKAKQFFNFDNYYVNNLNNDNFIIIKIKEIY